jgi:hypothetical protein
MKRFTSTIWIALALAPLFVAGCKEPVKSVATKSMEALERLNKTNNPGFVGDSYNKMRDLLNDSKINNGYLFKPEHLRLNSFRDRDEVGVSVGCFWFGTSPMPPISGSWHLQIGNRTYSGVASAVELDSFTMQAAKGDLNFVDINFLISKSDILGEFPVMVIWNSTNEDRKWRIVPDERQKRLSQSLADPETQKGSHLTLQGYFSSENIQAQ